MVEVHIHDLRQYGIGNYRQVDDYPYGGGGGMVTQNRALRRNASMRWLAERTYDEVIYLTPDGTTLTKK